MILNFFLDNRIGGPHIYSDQLKKFRRIKSINVTCGNSKLNSIKITNLRNKWKYLYFVEIIINLFEIIFLFKYKKFSTFHVFSIYNLAPILSGIFLKKKIIWFIVEKPNLLTKIIFKFLKFLVNFETIVISKFISQELSIKDYKIILPNLDAKFWNVNKMKKLNKKKIILTCVGNINKTKNHLKLLYFLDNLKLNFDLNIIGEALKTQKNYFKSIKAFQKKINKKKKKKVNILGRKNKFQVRSILKKTDIYILPSLSEGISISLMEAMSVKCFCMVSSNSNLSEIIKDDKNGFVFNLNSNSFINSINKYIKLNLIKKNRIKNNARETILDINKKSIIF